MRNFNGIPLPEATNGTLAQNAVAANTTADDVIAVKDAKVGDHVVVTPNGTVFDVGLTATMAWVSAAGTVTVRFMNTTAGALPAGATGLTYQVLCLPRG